MRIDDVAKVGDSLAEQQPFGEVAEGSGELGFALAHFSVKSNALLTALFLVFCTQSRCDHYKEREILRDMPEASHRSGGRVGQWRHARRQMS